jgi:hypothetical protein
VEPDTCSARATLQNDLRAAGSCRDPRCVQRARGQPRPGGRAVPVDRFGPDRRRSRSYVQAAKAPAGTLPPRGPLRQGAGAERGARSQRRFLQAGSSVFGWQRGGARSGTVPYGGGRTRRRRPKAGGALRSARASGRGCRRRLTATGRRRGGDDHDGAFCLLRCAERVCRRGEARALAPQPPPRHTSARHRSLSSGLCRLLQGRVGDGVMRCERLSLRPPPPPPGIGYDEPALVTTPCLRLKI